MERWKNRLLTAELAFAALALGSVHTWAVATCCVLAAAVFMLEWADAYAKDRTWKSPGPACVMALALSVFTALTLLPLPSGVVALLSPRAFEIRSSLFSDLLGTPAPAFMPLTIDVTATLVGLMKVIAATLTFLAVRHRVVREGSRSVLWCVAVSGLIVALVSLVHRLTGWDRVYDMYEPLFVHADPLPAPFLNPNHLAGALGLSAAVTVGLALDEDDTYKRVSLLVTAGLVGGALLLTLSRGGILCFIAGQVLFIVLRLHARLTSRRRGRRARRELAALPLALGVAVAAGAYVALRSIVEEFAEGDAGKFRIWQDAMPMLGDFWATGSGRGTFQLAYTGYQQLPDTSTYTHAENFLANWMGDWGVPVGGLVILFLLAVLVLGLLRPPRRARNAGALVALFALMVQNFADFGLELPGILLPFVVCLGVETVRLQMWAERWTGRSLDVPITRRPCLWGGLVLTIAAVLGVGAGVWHVHRHGLRVDDARIRSIGMEAALDDAFERELEAAMKRHPADYHLPQLGGIRAYHTGRDEPLPLLARSLYLYPGAAVSHLYVARTLARSGRIDQALVEYMETARRRPSLVPSVADEVVEICGGFAAARHWARLPADHALVYEALAEAYLRADMPEEARRADVAALSVDPRAAGPLRRSVRRHMKAGMWKDALELARRLTRVEDQRASGLALQAEIARATGEPEAALRLYERALAAEPRRRDIHLAMARIHFAREDTDALFDALDRYRATAPDERSRGRAIIVKAEYYRKLGMDNQAMAAYLEASSSLPDEARIWKAIAGIYEKQGDPVAALGAYRELARIEPEDPRWRKRVEEIVMEAKTRAISP